jgi:hypothetical protein
MIVPRFVILEHDHPTLHWDLMLEDEDALRTWRLAEIPQLNRETAAIYLARHRLMYLDYEGPVSGNRGTVSRWDAGTFTWKQDDADCLVTDLQGGLVTGVAMLKRIKGDEWIFYWLGGSEDAGTRLT